MKRWLSAITAILLSMTFMGLPTRAADKEFKVNDSLGKNELKFVPDEINVKFRNDKKPFRTIKVAAGSVKDEVAKYSKQANVEYAEPNYIAQAYMVPNDPYYSYQWNFKDKTQGGIELEQAWDKTTGSNVVVAILDTGIAYENYGNYYRAPDLADTKFTQGYDFINNDAHANDDNSHGTHVAGTVAQSTNNSLGVAGAAFGVTLMPVKVLNKKGSGTYSAIANGIYYAADNGAKVINMSLGGPDDSSILLDAIRYAHDVKGVTIVAAAGNEGSSFTGYPAAYDDYVIAVGATGYGGYLAPYSNYGSSVDLVAPGGDTSADKNGDGYVDGILQNTFDPTSKNPSSFNYYFFQGTSMATPHAAAAAALVIAYGAAVTPLEVQNILQSTAYDLGSSGRDNTFGWGLIDAAAALSGAPSPNNRPLAASQSVSTPEDIPKSIVLTGSDPDGDTISFQIASGPSHGTLKGTAPNLVYTPALNYFGDDSFTFRAYDGKAYSDSATISITVTPVNDPPTAGNISVTAKRNATIQVTLKGADVDGDPLTYEIVAPPDSGSVTLADHIATYVPNSGFTGTDKFTYRVRDGSTYSNTATVSITIKRK